ncbi:MAG: TetR/AcrR family transcriptional regulator [Flavobacteriales bacterium]
MTREEHILKSATGIFMRYGIKSVNMDDMAKHMGMSKKTIYVHFKDKHDLVGRAVEMFNAHEASEMAAIHEQKLNAVEEMFAINRWVISLLSQIHPSVMFDLEKYYAHSAVMLKEHRNKLVYTSMLSNLKVGQKQGFYRKDLDPEIIARIYIARLDMFFNEALFPRDSFKAIDIYMETFKYHIRGVASEKGLEYLTKHYKKDKKQTA